MKLKLKRDGDEIPPMSVVDSSARAPEVPIPESESESLRSGRPRSQLLRSIALIARAPLSPMSLDVMRSSRSDGNRELREVSAGMSEAWSPLLCSARSRNGRPGTQRLLLLSPLLPTASAMRRSECLSSWTFRSSNACKRAGRG